ncbi:MAG: fumarate hydratase C-terminal domain-containing protein, partial [Acidobacteriota bacterium]
MKRELTLPIDEKTVREFRVGDLLHLTGRLLTARDGAHQLMLEAHGRGESLPFDPKGM